LLQGYYGTVVFVVIIVIMVSLVFMTITIFTDIMIFLVIMVVMNIMVICGSNGNYSCFGYFQAIQELLNVKVEKRRENLNFF
jgi:hypothetical protein